MCDLLPVVYTISDFGAHLLQALAYTCKCNYVTGKTVFFHVVH